jgi:hypothetical protein
MKHAEYGSLIELKESIKSLEDVKAEKEREIETMLKEIQRLDEEKQLLNED